MATALTYSSLVSTLQAYLERASTLDTTVYSQLPSLINMAERAIARRLKISGMIIPVVTTMQVGLPVYRKPSGWRRTVSMNYGNIAGYNASSSLPVGGGGTVGTGPPFNTRNPIFARSYDYCRSYWPDQTVTGPPKFYADYNYQNWLIIPTPDQVYPLEINYYGLPNLLDSTNQSNFWTQFAPETLLYRTLLECTPFLKNDERIPVWKEMYEEAVTNLNTEDLSRVVDRASVRKED